MPRSSNANLSAETITELESQFYQFLNSLTPEERKDFFAEFLTTEEKMMMYKRLALYWSLLEGYPLARIQEMIGVTHDTTRVYNKRKNTLSDHFKSLVKRISTSQVLTQPHIKEEPVAAPQAMPEPQPQEDMTPQEMTPQAEPVVKEEVTVMEEVFAQKEPAEEIAETMEEKMEDMATKEIEMDRKDEEAIIQEEKMNELQEELKNEPEQARSESEDSSSLLPSDREKVQENEEATNEDGTQKKKSGLAKFFGF